MQMDIDPDEIFQTPGVDQNVNLVEIFNRERGSGSRRSTGNWSKDGLQPHEELEYKNMMGYTSPTAIESSPKTAPKVPPYPE